MASPNTTNQREQKYFSMRERMILLQCYKYDMNIMDVAKYFKTSRQAIYYQYRKFKNDNFVQDKKLTIKQIIETEGLDT